MCSSIIACPNDAVYAVTKAYVLHVSKGINAVNKFTAVFFVDPSGKIHVHPV